MITLQNGNQLRVVQLIKGLDIGGLHGGAELFGMNLSCSLQRAKVDTRLWVFFQMNTQAEERFLNELARCGVRVTFIQQWEGRTSLSAYFSVLQRLAALLRRDPADLLHSHFHVGTLFAILLKLTGFTHFAARTVHLDREWLRGWNGFIQQLLIRFFIFVLFPLLVDLECAVSNAAAEPLNQRILARLLKKQVPVVYNAIPTLNQPKRAVPSTEVGEAKKSGCFVIGSVGRLTEQKGLSYLLDAIPEIVRHLPHAKIWIVGDGPLRAELEDKARSLGMEEYILFWGKQEDVPSLLSQIDLFVLPSIFEGLPTVVLESMASGVPVIASDIHGVVDIIQDGHNGWLVPARDPQALSSCVVQAANNPTARLRVARTALETLKEFTIERAAEKYAALYERFI